MALDYNDLRRVKGNPSAEVAPGRRLKLNPGQDYPYDMPKELISALAENFRPEGLLDLTDQQLAGQGESFMRCLISLADSDAYRDRTAEMIEQVAQQTGIRFPHTFERYVELGILALRPRDAWTVSEATTKVLKVRNFSCSLGKDLAERGADCGIFCLAACKAAAEKANVDLNMAKTKDLLADGLCEMTFTVKQD